MALGDGNIGIAEWVDRYKALCPHAPLTLEIITGSPPRVLNYLDDAYWRAFPKSRAAEFARFERLVRQGTPFVGDMVVVSRGEKGPPEYEKALIAQQRYDLERSVKYCREVLRV